MNRLRRWWRARRRPIDAFPDECQCGKVLTRAERHRVIDTGDDERLEITAGGTFMSADFCAEHCPGGCDRGCARIEAA